MITYKNSGKASVHFTEPSKRSSAGRKEVQIHLKETFLPRKGRLLVSASSRPSLREAARKKQRKKQMPHASQNKKRALPQIQVMSRKRPDSVAVIVSAMNEEKTLGRLLNEMDRLAPQELIIVVNGCQDHTFDIAKQHPTATVLSYNEPVGHDVGRTIGAKVAVSDILLFIDADIPVSAEQIKPYIRAIQQGADVALNHMGPYLPVFADRDKVTVLKQFLNTSLGRSDLGADSMTAVPHALSRRALEIIGIENLMVPPRAHAMAIINGLTIVSPASVNVIKRNRRRAGNQGSLNPVSQMIIGDHLEAIHFVMQDLGVRYLHPDSMRRREFVGGGAHVSD